MTSARHVILPPDGCQPDGTKLGGWWHDADDGRMVCDLCPRECNLKPGDRGFCFVRQNRDGQMVLTTYGRSTGFCIDPIEKKPLNHFLPGTSVLSFGTAGCNLGCKFCQNHDISKAREVELLSEQATPETIADAAIELGCASVAYTYNDPVIWAEYAIDTAKACRRRGVKSVAVTAGYISPGARAPFFEYFDAANVDLKAFTEEFYYQLTLSHLQPVLDTLQWIHRETDVWFEITNLVIPGANDSTDELRRLCEWVLEHVGDEVPIHFSAFHPDFKMLDRPSTPHETLLRGYEVARAAGLKYAYVGNVDDAKHQSTYCPGCGNIVIERNWYELGQYQLNGQQCGHCGETIAGRFLDRPGNWGRKRQPVDISNFAPRDEKSTITLKGDATAQPGGEPMSTSSDTALTDSQPLNDEQQAVVFAAACEWVAAAVIGRREQLDQEFQSIASLPIDGAYVSLKRQQRLRGCCGFVGRESTLAAAVALAAQKTATEDPRLPPVSPTELRYLDVEVWLLQPPSPIDARGAERISQVEIGRHGLIIAKGDARGLLLPGVATEHELDAEGFLQQVCRKAGLPPTAWQEDATALHRFEGQCIAGPFDEGVWKRSARESKPLLDEAQFQSLLEFARQNVNLLQRGAVATTYLPGVPDGMVHGLTVSVAYQDGDPMHLSRLALRPPMPLQATLFSLGEEVAKILNARRLNASECRLDLTIYEDPAMHGLFSRPDLRGVEKRTLLSISGERSAWLYDPSEPVEELLQRVSSAMRLPIQQDAALYSLATQSSASMIQSTNVPAPQSGSKVRNPAVAGTFYPDDPDKLQSALDDLMPSEPIPVRPYRAVMVPHAGWRYSGRIAANVLARVSMPDTMIVIGPKHTREGVNCAVAPHETWSLPGFEVRSDEALAQELADAIPHLELDAGAHRREHGIEVELPIIHRLAPSAKVVGIAIGIGDWHDCETFANGLKQVLQRRKDRVLLVISSDMNHYANDQENRRLDEIAMKSLERLDPRSLLDTILDNKISMCGVLPAVSILQALNEIQPLKKAERVAYATSADVTGDTSRVVGYCGMLFD